MFSQKSLNIRIIRQVKRSYGDVEKKWRAKEVILERRHKVIKQNPVKLCQVFDKTKFNSFQYAIRNYLVLKCRYSTNITIVDGYCTYTLYWLPPA